MVVRLATPRLSVVLSEDATEAIEVQTINADMVLAETTARKHNWGSLQDSPLRFQTFIAWAALRRRKLIPPDLLWESFESTCASVSPVELEDTDYATPTPPDLASG
jgi:hypothetical protein